MVLETIKSMSPLERKAFLADNADKILDNELYRHYLTPDELTDSKDQHMKQSIEYAILEEQKKQLLAEIKEKMDEVKLAVTTLRQRVRMGYEEKRGNLYYFADQESGMMEVYDEQGNLVEHRKLRQDERQLNILSKVN